MGYLFPTAAFLLLAGGFLFTLGQLCPFLQQFETPAPPPFTQPPPAPIPVQPPNQTSPSDAIWFKITKSTVESECTAKAKEAAGANAWAVYGCLCVPHETDQEKDYDCTVSAFDGGHPVQISCSRPTRICTIVSEKGTSTVTFDELAASYG